MRMDGPHQIFDSSFEFHGGNGFGDQFGSLRTDNMDAENLSVICIGNYFNEPFMLTHDRSARVCGKRKFSDLDVVSRLPRPGLGETYAADFRMAISGTWYVFRINRLTRLARNFRRRDQRRHGPDVGELWHAQANVANG